MISRDDVPHVHSVAEAYLYLMISRCGSCGRGPLTQRGDLTRTKGAPGGWSLAARCQDCGSEDSISFAIEPAPTREEAQSDRVNPLPECSRAIDLLGWLSLFQTIIGKSQEQTDRQSARQLAHEAAQCLDEALKFYEEDNELPGDGAFFSEESRRRYRDHPQRFARSRWRQRRMMLPEIASEPAASQSQAPRPWWRFWRGGRG